MRLSEAIRLGSMIRPQITGRLFRHGGSCAEGAALEAIGYGFRPCDDLITPVFEGAAECFREQFPEWERLRQTPCPLCHRPAFVVGVIAHLNDAPHNWSREQIADFVATLEPTEEAPAPSERPRASQADGLQATHALVGVKK